MIAETAAEVLLLSGGCRHPAHKPIDYGTVVMLILLLFLLLFMVALMPLPLVMLPFWIRLLQPS